MLPRAMTDASRANQGEPTNPLDRLANKLQDVNTADAELGEVELKPFVGDRKKVSPGHERLGDFELLESLGEGGMGAVYRARQRSLDKLVAVKVIRPDFAFDVSRVARFRGEALAASKVQHPGIVSVHFVGEQDGVHYIAQELVPNGRTLKNLIEEWRKAPPPDHVRRAAALFVQIADALSAVHAANVVHRDIKPSNILLTPQDEPKVADFGLAKDLDGPRLSRTDASPGTLEYMSPEQVERRGGAIDARTDVYALGVTLYEALTLTRWVPEVTDLEKMRIIVEEQMRDLRTVRAAIPTELSLICRKAAEKEPHRRYQSMADFAADLRRYLANEPILAQPPSVVRRAQLWAKRNVVAAALSIAAVVVVVTAGVSVSVVLAKNDELELTAKERDAQARQATEKAKLAQDEATRANQQAEEAKRNAAETALVAEFQSRMLSDLSVDEFGHTMMVELHRDLRHNMERIGRSPEEIEQTTASVAEALRMANPTNVAQRLLEKSIFEPAVHTLEKEYADKPLLAATIQTPLAEACRALGLLELGERVARAAVEIRRAGLGDTHPDQLSSINNLALLLQDQGKLAEAAPLFREALAGRRAKLGDQHPSTLTSINNFASLLQAHGTFAEAEPLLREALAGRRAKLGDEHPSTLTAINNLASLLYTQGNLAEAEPLLREALAGCRAKLGDEHPSTLTSINNLALLLQAQGKFAEAEPLLREALAGRRAKLGDEHPDTHTSIYNFASLLYTQGKLAEAEPLFREALAGRRATLGDEHPYTLTSIGHFAVLLQALGRLAEAEPRYREALAGYRAKLGDEHPDTLTSINNFAAILQAQGKFAEAEPLFHEALAGSRVTLGDEHPDTRTTVRNLDSLYEAWHAAEPNAGHDQQAAGLRKLFREQ